MSSPAPTSAPAAPGAPAPEAPGTGGPAGFTHRQILVILSGLMLGMFLAALDQNIVSTSIRTIADDLNGLNLQAWATTAYLLTATISTPLYGKLSDLYGRKPFFLAAIGIFVVGSVLCTISTSMYELAAFRAVQGLGAGGLMSLALTIIGDIVPPRERARYQGFFLAVFGTSSVLGPVVGGFLAGTDTIIGITGWRWVFLVNVPIGLFAFGVVMKVLNLPHSRREHRIDAPGAIALAVTLVPILVVAEQGREWGWSSVSAIVCYVVAVAGLVGFLLAERAYGDDAVLPLRLFRNSVFAITSVIALITGVGLFGGIALVPQYLQIVTGSTPTRAGLEMLPLVGGLMVSSIVAGQLTSRTGRYKIFPVVGLGLMTLGLVLFHFRLHFDTPYGEVALLMVVFGLGVGLCMQTLVLAVQNAVPAKDMGVATASATFFRQMGGTIGVAVFLSILFSTVGDNIRTAFVTAVGSPSFLAAAADPGVRANPANAVALDPALGAGQVVSDSSVLQRMDSRLAEPFLVGFSDSMDLVFIVAAAVVAVGFVLIFFMKELPLRTQSGLQARDTESHATGAGTGTDAPAALEGTALDGPATVSPAAAGASMGSGAADDGPCPRGDGHGSTGEGSGPVGGGPDQGPEHGSGRSGPADTGPRLRGRVTTAGSPIGEVDVTLHDLAGVVLDRGRSQADGTFALRRGPDGTAVLIVSSPRHRPVARLVRLQGPGAAEEVDLQGAGDVAGTVHDTDGHPVGGATVTLTDSAGGVATVEHTREDGGWNAADLDQGRYTVAVLTADRAPVAGTVEVAGPVVHDVVVPAVRHTVSGRVRSSTGHPVGEALVVLVGDDGGVRASTVTDPSGTFRIDGVRGGRFMLTASGFAPVSREITVDARRDPEPVQVVVSAPQPVGPPAGDGHDQNRTNGHGGGNGRVTNGAGDGREIGHGNGNGNGHVPGNGRRGAHERPAEDVGTPRR